VLPGRKTPVIALGIAAAIAICFSLIGKVEQVALMTNFLMFLTFLMMNATVIYLRIKKPALKRPFKIPGSIRQVPVISVLAILLVLLLMSYTIYGLATGAGSGH
jgi:APA family basic amino acid/polyamine antiporter